MYSKDLADPPLERLRTAFHIDAFPATPGSSPRPTTSRSSTGRTARSPKRPTTIRWSSSPGTTPRRTPSDAPKPVLAASDGRAARGTRGEVYPPGGNQRTPAEVTCREGGKRSTTPVELLRKRCRPVRRVRHVRQHLGLVPDRVRTRPFASPFLRCAPSTFNDASADMLDDDTGFRCVTPAGTMRALLNLKSQPTKP